MFEINVVEKIKTYFMFHNFFPIGNRAVYEIMCKNVVEPERPEMTIKYGAHSLMVDKSTDEIIIRHMRFAC